MIVEPCNITERKDPNGFPLSWDEIHCEEGVYVCRYSGIKFIVLTAGCGKVGDETVILYYNGESLQPALNHVWRAHRFKKLDETVRLSVG